MSTNGHRQTHISQSDFQQHEERIRALEDGFNELSNQIARLDERSRNFATKADIAEIKSLIAEIHTLVEKNNAETHRLIAEKESKMWRLLWVQTIFVCGTIISALAVQLLS